MLARWLSRITSALTVIELAMTGFITYHIYHQRIYALIQNNRYYQLRGMDISLYRHSFLGGVQLSFGIYRRYVGVAIDENRPKYSLMKRR